MHSKSKLLVTLGAILLCSNPAFAEKWHTSTIDKVYVVSSGDLILVLSEDDVFCTDANEPNYYRVIVGNNQMTTDGQKHILSLALAAAATGTPVTFAYDETSSFCYINRLMVRYDLVG